MPLFGRSTSVCLSFFTGWICSTCSLLITGSGVDIGADWKEDNSWKEGEEDDDDEGEGEGEGEGEEDDDEGEGEGEDDDDGDGDNDGEAEAEDNGNDDILESCFDGSTGDEGASEESVDSFAINAVCSCFTIVSGSIEPLP